MYLILSSTGQWKIGWISNGMQLNNEWLVATHIVWISLICGIEISGMVVNNRQLFKVRLIWIPEIFVTQSSSCFQICEILSHSPKKCEKDPENGQPLKNVDGTAGKIACNLVGVRYHPVKSLTAVSLTIRGSFTIVLWH